jgi:hypothetical protein
MESLVSLAIKTVEKKNQNLAKTKNLIDAKEYNV